MRATKLAFLAILMASPLLGDEVLLQNGDRLTGTIVQTDEEKLTINTALAGNVIVEMKDVKTFSTDEPITLKLKDGNTLDDKVTAGADGTVNTAGAGGMIEAVPLANIAAINPPPIKWTGDITAGGMLTRGNSQSEQLNVGFDASLRRENDAVKVSANYLYGEQRINTVNAAGQTVGTSNSTSTDNWLVSGLYKYFFTKKFYGYGDVTIQKDRIADIDFRGTPSGGVGYQWLEKPMLSFSTEIGAGWVYQYYHHVGSDEYASGRAAYNLSASLNDKVTFFNNEEFLQSLQNQAQFLSTMNTGFRVTLTKRMFAELKNQWQYNAAPAPGFYKNDLRWILNVGWTF